MPWRPSFPGEFPTLGWGMLDWYSDNLAAPDRAEYEPLVLTQEQAEFILEFYRLDPFTGRRVIRRAVLSRPRGWGKSPILGAVCCGEALGPAVFDGWDAAGQPVGKPWNTVRNPVVQVAAVAEVQTRNTWLPILDMMRGPNMDAPVLDNYRVDVFDTRVIVPRGYIEPLATSGSSVKGSRAVFAVLDQTETWTRSNGGLKMAETMRANAAKVNGTTIETPNAYTPGEGSVAENSAAYAAAIAEGRTRDDGLLHSHREAPGDTALDERESLELGLRIAYGDSSAHPDGCLLHEPPCAPGWVDIDRLIAEVWDVGTEPQQARSDYLNQVTHAADAWLSAPEWSARYGDALEEPVRPIADGDTVVLGFDGSRKRARGVTDATALIGCRIEDGHLFEVRVWEQPSGPAGAEWQAPTTEVDAEVRSAFDRWDVVGLYADPALWETYVAQWEARYAKRLRVKANNAHPCEFWMTGGRATTTVRALEAFHTAVVEGELTHDGSSALTRHVLNARRRVSRSGLQIGKAHKESDKKIDAAVAAVLAWAARVDAIAAGIGPSKRTRAVPQRIR